MRNKIETKALILLKLAYEIRQFKFADAKVADAFPRLLYFCTKKTVKKLPSYSQFLSILRMDSVDALTEPDKKIIEAVKKKYAVKKGLFPPRICYKYIAALQICYINSLADGKYNQDKHDGLFKLLRINKKARDLLSQYMTYVLSGETYPLIGITQNAKIKYFAETAMPLTKFFIREYGYYERPRTNVSVFATMSAGKSTFINALLGRDYLPSLNEACTSKVVSISDNDKIDYCLGYAVKNGKPVFNGNITPETLAEWNSSNGVSEVFLEGDLDRISCKSAVTVIHDTPGINYSRNETHKKITLQHLTKIKPDAIVCLMDATQMYISDFQEVVLSLKNILTQRPSVKLLFVINKADNFDAEKESIQALVKNAAEELEKYGFKTPIVVPVSSRAARLFKMALKGNINFSENEIDDFTHYLRFFSRFENNFNLLPTGVPEKFKYNTKYPTKGKSEIVIEGNTYDRDQITAALFNTGIAVVENMLNAQKEQIK
jgi:GTPase SAR1 family protein